MALDSVAAHCQLKSHFHVFIDAKSSFVLSLVSGAKVARPARSTSDERVTVQASRMGFWVELSACTCDGLVRAAGST